MLVLLDGRYSFGKSAVATTGNLYYVLFNRSVYEYGLAACWTPCPASRAFCIVDTEALTLAILRDGRSVASPCASIPLFHTVVVIVQRQMWPLRPVIVRQVAPSCAKLRQTYMVENKCLFSIHCINWAIPSRVCEYM